MAPVGVGWEGGGGEDAGAANGTVVSRSECFPDDAVCAPGKKTHDWLSVSDGEIDSNGPFVLIVLHLLPRDTFHEIHACGAQSVADRWRIAMSARTLQAVIRCVPVCAAA